MTFTFTDKEKEIIIYALRSHAHSLKSQIESGYGDEDLLIEAYNKVTALIDYIAEGDKDEQHN